MKKELAIFLAGILCLTLLAGCKEKTPEPTTGKPAESTAATTQNQPTSGNAPQLQGEWFDAGNVQTLVPEGWKAFPQKDVFAEDPDATDPDVLCICKDGQTDLDLLTKPFVRIDYYGPDTQMMGGLKDFYSNVEDLEPMQLGPYTWTGFTTTDYGLMAVLTAEDGDHQYQASVYLDVSGIKISLEDGDVQAILANVKPSDGTVTSDPEPADTQPESVPETTEAPAADYSWWAGQWYGWWCLYDAEGIYAQYDNIAWDAYAQIDVGGEFGHIRIWDTILREFGTLVNCDVRFEPGSGDHGTMVSVYGNFFDSADWNADTIRSVPALIEETQWRIDPADSTVSHFENMLEISGTYTDPENSDNTFRYSIFLRPWGTDWMDVYSGDTSGCIYSDMMPVYYNEWYVALVNKGYTQMPESFAAGIALLEGDAQDAAD